MDRLAMIRTAVIAMILIGVASWLANQSREPMYHGKPLSFWLEEYQAQWKITGFAIENSPNEARAAIQEIGAKGVPHLLIYARAKDSRYTAWMQSDSGFKHAIFRRRSAIDRQDMAVLGFYTIGASGADAVPELIQLTSEPHSSKTALICLCYIGEPAKPALPLFIAKSKGTNGERFWATMAMGKIHSQADLVVPLLIKNLVSTNEITQSIRALEKFGPQATPAVPYILPYLAFPSTKIQRAATNALRAIDPETAEKYGISTNNPVGVAADANSVQNW